MTPTDSTDPTDTETDIADSRRARETAVRAIGHLDAALTENGAQRREMNRALALLEEVDVDAVDDAIAERVEYAREKVAELEAAAPDEYGAIMAPALAELAPLAAQAAGPSSDVDESRPPSEREKPTVPVFYQVPKEAVDRAIERFQRRRESGTKRRKWLQEYIYDEIQENHVIYVDGGPLEEYAKGRVESLTIEPTQE